MQTPIPNEFGLTEALDVAKGQAIPPATEGDAKLLAFFLRDGECTAEVSEAGISVWYSWLLKSLPSRYSICLAPGLVGRLMKLGGVQKIADEATFPVGPGTTGTGQYVFDFKRK